MCFYINIDFNVLRQKPDVSFFFITHLEYKYKILHLVREKCFQNQHRSSFPTPCRNLPTDHFKNKPLLCKHSDKVAFLIVEKIYFRLNSHSSKHNILFICVENKSVNTFARSLDYHKTDRKKLINYTPQHHMLLYNIDYHCI